MAAALISVAVATYLAISQVHGALGVARNDDWAYYRSAWEFAQDGYFDPDPYTLTMLVGQTVLAQPLVALAGTGLAAYQVAVAVLGGIGLYASFAALRSFLAPRWALLSVGCLALGPIFGSISVTFMSDVPALALQALCLWAGVTALRRDPVFLGWLVVSLALGLLAFSIREYAIAAPAAVLLVSVWRTRSRGRTRGAILALGIVLLALVGALYLWRSSLGADGPVALTAGDPEDLGRIVKSVFTLALLVSPAVVAVATQLPRALSARPVAVGLVMAASGILGALAWAQTGEVLLRNYLTQTGSYPETLHGPQVEVLPGWLWFGLNVAAVLSAVVAAGLLVGLPRPRPSSDGAVVAAVFVVLTLTVVAAAHLLAGTPLFDRYLIPAVPFAAGVLLFTAGPLGRSGFRAGLAALLVWAVVGLHVVDTTATHDGLKWQAGRELEGGGYSPETIEAGLEWFGLHQDQPVRAREPHPGQKVFWWGLFADPEACVLVSTATPGDPTLPGGSEPVLDLSGQSLLGVGYHLAAYPTPEWCGGVP